MAEQQRGSDQTSSKPHKIFNDSVHGHIKMHPFLVEIIDTPEFQRLRDIKQLGGGYFVFPGASHNRFEHSIGVAHLAGELVRSLRAQGNDIPDKDELCVQIAGLCHDLGHGPFSHVFENFMKKVKPDEPWEHEELSGEILEMLIKRKVKSLMSYNIRKHDIHFIQDLIMGKDRSDERADERADKRRKANEHEDTIKDIERRKDNRFLFEIVANKPTGIDVDKMDYFSRDCLHLGMKSNFSHERYVMFARVCNIRDEGKHICMRDKEALNMYELFHVRYLLHRNVYQHRVTMAVETMIVDAFMEAEKDFKLDGKTISEAAREAETHVKLTDAILEQLKKSSKAKNIIERIEKRKLYYFVGSKIFRTDELENTDENNQEENLEEWLNIFPGTKPEDFRVRIIKINYGKGQSDPIEALRFYDKANQAEAKPLESLDSYIRPSIFQEIKVCVFYVKKPVAEFKQHISEFWEILKRSSGSSPGSSPGSSSGV